MNLYDEALSKALWIKFNKDINVDEIIKALERAKKAEVLLGLKNEQLSIFQFERNHFCSMTDESYERLKALDLQIKALDEELKMITHEEVIQISKHYNLNINQSSTIEKYALQQQAKEERAKKVEEFISLCYVETTDTGHEVVFWRDENYEYAKQLLKILKGELK